MQAAVLPSSSETIKQKYLSSDHMLGSLVNTVWFHLSSKNSQLHLFLFVLVFVCGFPNIFKGVYVGRLLKVEMVLQWNKFTFIFLALYLFFLTGQ